MSDDKALYLVLDLRKKEEDDAMQMWVDSKNAVANFKLQLEQIDQFKQIYLNELEVKSLNGMDMNKYMAYQQFIEKLEKIKIRQENGLKKLEAQEIRARDNYLEKQKQRKIIESLIEKHKMERRIKEAKAEQKLTDDIVSSKQARLLMDRNNN